jgi:hypothetical protein
VSSANWEPLRSVRRACRSVEQDLRVEVNPVVIDGARWNAKKPEPFVAQINHWCRSPSTDRVNDARRHVRTARLLAADVITADDLTEAEDIRREFLRAEGVSGGW